VVVKCLKNMALLIMTKLYNGVWVFQANISSYKHITLKEKYNSSEIAIEIIIGSTSNTVFSSKNDGIK
jgi:hypothetical protein